MKKFETPELLELDINETAHNWTGNSSDGGYVGDGVLSGHSKWTWSCGGGNNGSNNRKPGDESGSGNDGSGFDESDSLS